MNTARPDLNLLAALRALLEEANLTRAGQRLHLGQSVMSSALVRLRGIFQDELLVRIGRDYELTPFAQTLLPKVQIAVPHLQRILSPDEEVDPAHASRTLRVMITDYGLMQVNGPFAAVLSKAPEMDVQFVRLPERPMESERDLVTHDFIVSVPGIGIDGPNVQIARDEYVCLVDRNNPALRDGRLSLNDFLELPHAVARYGRLHYSPADRVLREMGLYRREPRIVATSFLPLASVVAGTELVAVVPRKLAETVGPATGTVGVEAPFGRVEVNLHLWWHDSYADDLVHRWFRQQLLLAMGIDELV